MLRPMPDPESDVAPSASVGLVNAARYVIVQRLMDSLLHDVRNPLNALAINLDVLTEKLKGPDKVVPPNQEKNLKAMREQVFRVDGILKVFADYLTPKTHAQGEPPTMTDRIVRSLDVLGHEMRRNRVGLRQMIEPNVRVKEKDHAALNFIVVQSLLRAVARSQAGGEVSVTLVAEKGRAVLTVSDSASDAQEPFPDAAIALQLEAEKQGGEARVRGGDCVVTLPLA